ncbi:MAG: CDP-glycerol glycerophosphotransferase family protein [Clostridia bacterium]|nr:CDP-glycerol glycerophosphotransferase family protein [Clostridia bacterium]
MTLKALLKKTKFTYKLAVMLRRAPDPFLAGWMRLCHGIFGVDKNKVYFSSFGGMLPNDNPRAVCEALHEICPEAKLVFRVNRQGMAEETPDYIVKVPQRSLKALKEMATSRVLVKNAGMLPWMRKFSDQYYIQTWHGDRGFKKIRLDRNAPAKPLLREAEYLDLMVSGSRFGSDVYRTAFAYKGEILECGCPRNDILLENPAEIAEKTRRELGIDPGVKVLLYAPTFRNSTTGSKFHALLSLSRVRETLEKSTGEKWVCLSRGHVLTLGVQSEAQMDVSRFPDVNPLLLISDMVISDYSSLAGDFMLLNRPAIFFQPDLDEYLDERGLYFDPLKSPLIVARTEDELVDILSRPIDAAANCRDVLNFFGSYETGSAALLTARRIAEILKK